jgi:uncharacterized protein (DUF2147 family)
LARTCASAVNKWSIAEEPLIYSVPMKTIALLLCAAALLAFAPPQPSGIVGDWAEPTGSIIRIASCGQDLCARLIFISPQAPTRFDVRNPDQALRSRPLCGLEIGRGFHLSDPEHADGGTLYDPKSGKTYRGSMTGNGDRLELRGYIGIKVFGRSEIWTRSSAISSVCVPF